MLNTKTPTSTIAEQKGITHEPLLLSLFMAAKLLENLYKVSLPIVQYLLLIIILPHLRKQLRALPKRSKLCLTGS